MTQLELELPHPLACERCRRINCNCLCPCGAELVSHINHYRQRCDRCILREGPPAGGEDPDPKRRAFERWLAARQRYAVR